MSTPPGKFNELELFFIRSVVFVIEFRTFSFRSKAASEADLSSDVFLDSKDDEQPDDLGSEAESDRYAKDGGRER